jgi:hypothetical protein
MKVLIRFKDNDFNRVLEKFGKLLLPKVISSSPDVTPENIVRWFNAIAPTLYEMSWDYFSVRTQKEQAELRHYLQITTANVFMDTAAVEKLATAHQWSNYDSVVIDGYESLRDGVYLI